MIRLCPPTWVDGAPSDSGRVLTVDFDVLLGQITTPGGSFSRPQVQVDAYENVGSGHLCHRRGPVELKDLAIAHEPDRAHAYVGPERVDVGSAVADCAKDSPPVWIGSVDGRLQQAGRRHGTSRAPGVFYRPGASNRNFDEFRCPLTIASDLLGQINRDGCERVSKNSRFGRFGGDGCVAGGAVCEAEK